MAATYSTYEAKTRFSEIIRKVRAGQRVEITYHGEVVAEIQPVSAAEQGLEKRIERLEHDGIVTPPSASAAGFSPLARRRGALKRFLEDRD